MVEEDDRCIYCLSKTCAGNCPERDYEPDPHEEED